MPSFTDNTQGRPNADNVQQTRKSTGFNDLPQEIQDQIWRMAMQPGKKMGITRQNSVFWNCPYIGDGPVRDVSLARRTIAKVSQKARREVLRVNQLRMMNGLGVTRLLDHTSDIIFVRDMYIPQIERTSLWPEAGMADAAIPIERLLSLRVMLPYALSEMPHNLEYSSIPGGPLDLTILPRLGEYWGAYTFAREDFHVPGYQMAGPEVMCELFRDSPYYDFDTAAEEMSRCRAASGVETDTGINWRMAHWLPRGPAGPPRIGFHGFSSGFRSLGGQWAGFRYHVGTGRVEFRPLRWDEVSDASLHLHDHFYHLQAFPGMVVKVVIVRDGEAAPLDEPHSCWVDVQGWTSGESEAACIIRCLWQSVKENFNEQDTDDHTPAWMGGGDLRFVGWERERW